MLQTLKHDFVVAHKLEACILCKIWQCVYSLCVTIIIEVGEEIHMKFHLYAQA